MASRQQNEIAVIGEFLPQQVTAGEVEAAIVAAIAEAGSVSIRDVGRVMAVLKGKYPGQMDFGSVGAVLKARLGRAVIRLRKLSAMRKT